MAYVGTVGYGVNDMVTGFANDAAPFDTIGRRALRLDHLRPGLHCKYTLLLAEALLPVQPILSRCHSSAGYVADPDDFSVHRDRTCIASAESHTVYPGNMDAVWRWVVVHVATQIGKSALGFFR